MIHLGQKLSLIGLKSDLARKIIEKDPEKARSELKDIQQTARTALNEVQKNGIEYAWNSPKRRNDSCKTNTRSSRNRACD